MQQKLVIKYVKYENLEIFLKYPNGFEVEE
jgi:hypothetical protein